VPKHFHTVVSQRDLRPAYYDNFHCLMGDCRLNCCTGGWHIAFGKKDYLTIKKQRGSPELNAGLDHCLRRVRENVDEKMRYGEFVLQDGDCPLLRESKCGLQMEKGEKVLPFVCRTFPRVEKPMPSGYLERSLTPACEGVLALLWDREEGIDFRSDPLERSEWRTSTHEIDEEKPSLWPHFRDIRSLCIDILQDRRHPLPERLLLLGMALRPLAEGETDVPAWLERSRALTEAGEPSGLLQDKLLPMFLANNVSTVLSINSPDQRFCAARDELRSALGILDYNACRGSILPGAYLTARERFGEQIGGREYFFENLMVTVFFHMRMPDLTSPEALWKSYVSFCNLYSAYRFLSVMSCREGVEDCRTELFDLLVLASRGLIHNPRRQNAFRDNLFSHDSATLAHMAVLLSG